MTAFTELFNGAADGVAVSTSNSVFTFIPGTGGPEFDSGITYRVPQSMLVVNDGVNRYGRRDALNVPSLSSSVYVRFGSVAPSASTIFYRHTDSAGAQSFTLLVSTTGRIVAQDSGSTTIASTNIAGHAIIANTWYRIDVMVTKGAGTGRLQYRICNVNTTDTNTPITTPYDSGATLQLGANNIDRIYVGAVNATTRNGVWSYGILRYDDARTTYFDQYGGLVKYWNGSAWVLKPMKYGASWAETNIKRWNGSAWVTSS